jgi:hypothetical protein
MFISVLAHVLAVVTGKGAAMPPTSEQLAPRLLAIPRCVALPVMPTVQARGAAPSMTTADRIADAMHRLQRQFSNLRCKEGRTK